MCTVLYSGVRLAAACTIYSTVRCELVLVVVGYNEEKGTDGYASSRHRVG